MCMKIQNPLSEGFGCLSNCVKILTCSSQWNQLPKNMKECKFLHKCRTIYHIFGLSVSEFTIPCRIGSKLHRNALAVMAHFFSATLVLSSSVSFLSRLQVFFDIDMSKWDEVLLCQSLYKPNVAARSRWEVQAFPSSMTGLGAKGVWLHLTAKPEQTMSFSPLPAMCSCHFSWNCVIWRKKENQTNHKQILIFIWLSNWTNTCKVIIFRSQPWETLQLSWINASILWIFTISLLITGPTTLTRILSPRESPYAVCNSIYLFPGILLELTNG